MTPEEGIVSEIGAVGVRPRSVEPTAEPSRLERPPASHGARTAFGRLLFNAFPFGVVAAFIWLQTIIGRQAQGTAMQVELGAAALVEIGLVFAWSLLLD